MDKRLLKSALSLVVVIALGAGTTFAVLQSQPVEITSNVITTGSADIALCDAKDTNTNPDTWTNTITGYTLIGLAPGDTNQELTDTQELYLGNDDGTLETAISGECTGDSTGTSSVSLRMVPSVNLGTCAAGLADDLKLKFQIGANSTTYQTLTAWDTNVATTPPTFAEGDANQLKVFAEMANDADSSGSCNFDISFIGEQVI